MKRPLLLGHRGARKYAPENTLAAFQLALEHGCDGFEFDVRMTSDGVPVVCHDPKYKRIEVARCHYSELRETYAEIPTLEEVLASFAGSAFLNLELKTSGAEEKIAELLRVQPAKKGIVVSSFLPEVLLKLLQVKLEFPLGLICKSKRQLAQHRNLPLRALMLEKGLVQESILASVRSCEDANSEESTQVFVWTVNSESEMKRLSEMGVDGIISDDTKLLVQTVT